jgi:hypothetical protein
MRSPLLKFKKRKNKLWRLVRHNMRVRVPKEFLSEYENIKKTHSGPESWDKESGFIMSLSRHEIFEKFV